MAKSRPDGISPRQEIKQVSATSASFLLGKFNNSKNDKIIFAKF
jgi:hypothetical protein